MTNIISIIAILLAGMLLMICHEFSKELMYSFLHKTKNKKIFRLYQYIDPIGLLFCVMLQVGFSKPYTKLIKGRKENIIVGITGYCSLFMITVLALFISRIFNHFFLRENSYFHLFIYMFLQAMSILGTSMFLINLYPLPTFDMGLIIAGKAPVKFVSLFYSDYQIKILFVMFLIIGVVSNFSTYLYKLIAW